MRRAWSILLLFFMIMQLAVPLSCDTMIIPSDPDTIISQPHQIVAISWDNNYEVMLLGVSFFAYKNDVGVQILPLPSIPEVELGNVESLKKIVEMYPRFPFHYGPGASSGIVFEKILGPHHIACIEVEGENVATRIRNYAMKYNVNITITFSQLLILQDYIRRGYKYFLVDIVNISSTPSFIQPLIVKFRTDHIWFPLYISSLYLGFTHVYITVITRKIPKIPEILTERFTIYKKILSRADIANIDERLLEPFGWGYFFYATLFWGYDYTSNFNFDVVINTFEEFPFMIMMIATVIPLLFFGCLIAIPFVSKKFKKELDYKMKKGYLIASIFILIFSFILLLVDIPLCILYASYITLYKLTVYGITLATLLQLSLAIMVGYSIFVFISYITKRSSKVNDKFFRFGLNAYRILFDLALVFLLLGMGILIAYIFIIYWYYITSIIIVHWMIVVSVFLLIPGYDLYATIKRILKKESKLY